MPPSQNSGRSIIESGAVIHVLAMWVMSNYRFFKQNNHIRFEQATTAKSGAVFVCRMAGLL